MAGSGDCTIVHNYAQCTLPFNIHSSYTTLHFSLWMHVVGQDRTGQDRWISERKNQPTISLVWLNQKNNETTNEPSTNKPTKQLNQQTNWQTNKHPYKQTNQLTSKPTKKLTYKRTNYTTMIEQTNKTTRDPTVSIENIWYRKKVSVSIYILGTVTHC